MLLQEPKEKLIITGSVRDFGKTIVKWSGRATSKGDKLQEYAMLKAINYLDWIAPSVLRHKSFSELRDYADEKGCFVGQLLQDDSEWDFHKWNKAELGKGEASEEATLNVDFAKLLENEEE